ncbi:MAG: AAA family ATPase [Proteobacteria bacterium]|nr:AAA family ATPase [Pseudomonadota bacterium]
MKLIPLDERLLVAPPCPQVSVPTKVLICRNEHKDQRDPWPNGQTPTWEAICADLDKSRSAYCIRTQKDGRDVIEFQAGYLLVRAIFSRNTDGDGYLLRLLGVRLANGADRKRLLVGGIALRHSGIWVDSLRTLGRFGPEGSAQALMAGVPVAERGAADGERDESTVDEAPPMAGAESELLESLDLFVEAEHELEQLKASQQGQYAYYAVTTLPGSRRLQTQVRLSVVEADWQRLSALPAPPGMIAVASEFGEPVILGVEGLQRQADACFLLASCARQGGRLALPDNGTFTAAALDVQKRVRMGVAAQLRDRSAANPWLVQVAARTANLPDFACGSSRESTGLDGLNRSQRDAVTRGLASPDVMLVLGPPGTGKTTVIYNWVNQFVRTGLRVLVASQNNKAVDNVLERLARDKALTCVRLGDEKRVSSGLADLLIDNRAVELQRQLLAGSRQGREGLRDLHARVQADPDHAVQPPACDANEHPAWPCVDPQLQSELAGADAACAATASELARVVDQLKALRSRRGPIAWLQWPWRWWVGRREAPLRTRANHLEDARNSICGRIGHALAEALQVVDDWQTTLDGCRQEDLYPLLIDLVDVVGATCIGINSKPWFRDERFDVAIVDEAGQIQLHNLMVPLSKAPKAILVGDHKQLPPVVADELIAEVESRAEALVSDVDSELLRKSWFECAWDALPASRRAMLDTQFRCPSAISDFISAAFYEGNYYAGEAMQGRQPIDPIFRSTMVFVDTSDLSPAQRAESSRRVDGRQDVAGNRAETELVACVLDWLCRKHADCAQAGEIGVIVPYKNHVAEIHRRLEKDRKAGKLATLRTPIGELVASVDSYQGQERDVIVFAFSRSNPRGAVGFLADWRRLNVAMTRTKRQLIMIGDLSTLTGPARADGPDVKFKRAMGLLHEHLARAGQIVPSRRLPGMLQ